MKNFFTVLIVLLAVKSYSQSYYKKLFDANYKTHLWDSDSGDQTNFSWATSAHMEALVLMYEKIKDKDYAETLIKCIGNVIDRRDDLREEKPSLNLKKIFDYRDISGAAWNQSL